MYTYPGNIHIHSTHSDGSGTIAEIATAAAAAGLSFVIISDHETLAGLPEEAICQGVLVLVGAEINKDKNHYLALGIDKPVQFDDEHPQNVIDRVCQAGGIGFIAHPFDRGSLYIEKGKAFPWRDWPVFGFNGMEIWNFSSHWRGLHPSLFRTLYWFFFNRRGAMKGPPRRLLRLWDCYNSNGHRIVAIGSSDAHAYRYRLALCSIIIFTYRYTFTTINTYIVMKEKLSGNFTEAKAQVIDALSRGCCFTSFETLGKAKEFSFTALAGDQLILMGGEIRMERRIKLQIKAPGKRSLIRLICSGELLLETKQPEIIYEAYRPGVYRVEVYYRPHCGRARPWIFSNPIYILPFQYSR
ncbi:MAG: CehA/McbA family metallohydrolase [Bacillota bacterium]|nr:CehA/McbA family metallohydrolase [Bacillota bacterium]